MARGQERRNRSPVVLGELLDTAYPKKGPAEAELSRLLAWWQRAVPERVLLRARPVRVWQGILTVHTATAAWATELDHLREPLLESLQKISGFARVRELRFRVGPLPELLRPTRPSPRRPAPTPLSVLPEDLARALGRIGDDELRDVIALAASISLGRVSRE